MSVLSILYIKLHDDEVVTRLHTNDPVFRNAYDMLVQFGESDELLADIIIKISTIKNDAINQAIDATSRCVSRPALPYRGVE